VVKEFFMTDTVISALEDQVGCYRKLAKLTELQHVHVQQSQTEALLDVLRSRQTVLDEITRLETVVGPAKREWSIYVGRFDAQQRTKAESLLTETRTLLEQITVADQNDALVLQQRKLNLGKQISQASAATKVNRTYAASAYGTRPSRMDFKHQ
jgi:hypothetical protein